MEEKNAKDLTGRACPYPQCRGKLEFNQEKNINECSRCAVVVKDQNDNKCQMWMYSIAVSQKSDTYLSRC